jgi:hypothetical protein
MAFTTATVPELTWSFSCRVLIAQTKSLMVSCTSSAMVFILFTTSFNMFCCADILSATSLNKLLLDPDIVAGSFGYVDADLTGDGVVDAFDYIVLDGNLVNEIGAVTP